jgi:hypothetical protein
MMIVLMVSVFILKNETELHDNSTITILAALYGNLLSLAKDNNVNCNKVKHSFIYEST